MKLLKPASCPRETGRGNVKSRTALGEASFVRSSDRGSTPLGSTSQKTPNHRGFGRFSFESVHTLVHVLFFYVQNILKNAVNNCCCAMPVTLKRYFTVDLSENSAKRSFLDQFRIFGDME